MGKSLPPTQTSPCLGNPYSSPPPFAQSSAFTNTAIVIIHGISTPLQSETLRLQNSHQRREVAALHAVFLSLNPGKPFSPQGTEAAQMRRLTYKTDRSAQYSA